MNNKLLVTLLIALMCFADLRCISASDIDDNSSYENYTIETFVDSFDDYNILNHIVTFGSDNYYQEYESAPFSLYGVLCHATVELVEGETEKVKIVFDEIDQSINDIIDRLSEIYGSYQNIDEEGDVYYWQTDSTSIILGIHEPPAYILLNRIVSNDDNDSSEKEYYSSYDEVLQSHWEEYNQYFKEYDPYTQIDYLYYDITGDGIDELIVNRQIGKHGYTLYIYRINGDSVELLYSLEHDGGTIYTADTNIAVVYVNKNDRWAYTVSWDGESIIERKVQDSDNFEKYDELNDEELIYDLLDCQNVVELRNWIDLKNEKEEFEDYESDNISASNQAYNLFDIIYSVSDGKMTLFDLSDNDERHSIDFSGNVFELYGFDCRISNYELNDNNSKILIEVLDNKNDPIDLSDTISMLLEQSPHVDVEDSYTWVIDNCQINLSVHEPPAKITIIYDNDYSEGDKSHAVSTSDERFNLDNYVYRKVSPPEGQNTLVFQETPKGNFLDRYVFHNGDTIYVNDNWRDDGYAIAYQDGVYGYVDENYIDWSGFHSKATDDSNDNDMALSVPAKVPTLDEENHSDLFAKDENNNVRFDLSETVGLNISDLTDIFLGLGLKELKKEDDIIKWGNSNISVACNRNGTVVRVRIDETDRDFCLGEIVTKINPDNLTQYLNTIGFDSYEKQIVDDWTAYISNDKFFAVSNNKDGNAIKSMYYGLLGYCPINLNYDLNNDISTDQEPDIIGKVNYDTNSWGDLVGYNSDLEIYCKSVPAIIKLSEDDYNLFVHGSENDTELSVKRTGYVDLIKLLFNDSACILTATPIGEDLTNNFTYGNINVIPNYFLLAEKTFDYLIEQNDPVFLGSILNGMGVSSLDDVSVIQNEKLTYLYNEGLLDNNHFYCHYVTLKGTTLIEVYAETGLEHNEPQVRQLSRYLKDSIHYCDDEYTYEESQYSQIKKADTVYLNQYLGKRISGLLEKFDFHVEKRVDGYASYITPDDIEFDVLDITENEDSVLYEMIFAIILPGNIGDKYSIYGMYGNMNASEIQEYCEHRSWPVIHGTYYSTDGNRIYTMDGKGLYVGLDPRSYSIYPARVLDSNDLARYMYYSVSEITKMYPDAKVVEDDCTVSIFTDDAVYTAIQINGNANDAIVYSIKLNEFSDNKNIYGIKPDMTQNEKIEIIEKNGLIFDVDGYFDGVYDVFDKNEIEIYDRLTDDSPFAKGVNLLDYGKSYKELKESWRY